MHATLEKFMKGYLQAKTETFANNPFGDFVRKDIPKKLYETGLINSGKYYIKSSVGQGNWAMVPWICIFDRNITTTATKGVYIVYLLSKDCKDLYLTFNQGCTDIRNTHSKIETVEILRSNAKDIIKEIDSRGFATDENIYLGENLTDLGYLYQKGTIFYKKYLIDSVPDDNELLDDLSRMLEIYKDYVDKKDSVNESTDLDTPEEEDKEMPSTAKEVLDQVKSYIASKGFIYNNGLIENFYLSLKSKPFVILAGTSGTGKTRLVKLFAEAIGAEYKMVPVRPDWSDSTDLFGHLDLNGHYLPGTILEFIVNAQKNTDKPYILCLDEMNLARVEYYLSDFLSVIETRDMVGNSIVSEPLISLDKYGNDTEAINNYGVIRFPDNLYLVGTVNMDETTFPFSKKVLDRANTIEFDYVNLLPADDFIEHEGKLQTVTNEFLKAKYLLLVQCTEDIGYVRDLCERLQRYNEILKTANAHVGYRVRDEIVFYMLNNKEAELLPENEAWDNEVMQKILPRIQGSSTSVKEMLCELFKELVGDYEGFNTQSEDTASVMMKKIKEGTVPYPQSAEKIAFMVRRFEEDGFTSYWL